jgi:hypothetical protein
VSRGLIPLKTARQYCPGHGAEVREKSGHLIFTFTSQEEGGDWVDSEGVLSSLFPLRTELAQGDLRSLYLGWLLCAQGGELDDDTLEPPVPPNLGKPSRALSNFIDFLRIDDDLLNVALRTSVKTPASRRPRGEIARWVASLDVREKDKLLVRLLEEEAAPVGVELRVRFNRSQVERTTVTKTRRRTVGELLAAVEGSSGVELKQI